jgi:hypothetical protein
MQILKKGRSEILIEGRQSKQKIITERIEEKIVA